MSDSAEPGNAQVPASARDLLGYESIECEEQTPPRELVLKHDRLFLLTDQAGDIVPAGACELGLFDGDTRMLSHYELRVNGNRPGVLSSHASRVFASQIDLTVTDREFAGVFTEPKNFLHIRREHLLDGLLLDRMIFTNFMGRTVEMAVELRFAADYADIFEVRGAPRARRGEFRVPRVGAREVTWAYRGVDGRLRRTSLRFSVAPDEVEGDRARWVLRLRPREEAELRIRVTPRIGDGPTPPAGPSFAERHARIRRGYERWRRRSTRFHSRDGFFNAALEQATTDLHALMVRHEDRPIITAGIPWFTTPFGRDSLITSLQTLVVNPEIARETLRFLAAYQGEEEDDWTEEEPGKILHELRRGEMAAAGEVPHVPYYGTVDATPLFLILLGEAFRWTGDRRFVRSLLPNAERALDWIDEHGDLDGDGFVEYARRSPGGLVNQGWKDSGDGVPYPDGTLPEPPIALIEVQGYVYAAKRQMAALYESFGEDARAEQLRSEAETLRQRIHEVFWLEEPGYFALALDGDKRPLPTIASNAGHLLWSGVPTPEQAQRMVDVLLSDDMFSGWGIRTIARGQPVYNPLSYHDGTIWPHDNSIIALGLARYGFREEAATLLTVLFEASLHFRYQRLPELFCGIWRGETDRPVDYPVSCSPQAWAAGALFPLIQGVLGIRPDASRGMLCLHRPHLPRQFSFLDVLGMRVGASRVTLRFTREGERTMANVAGVEGEPLHVRIDVL